MKNYKILILISISIICGFVLSEFVFAATETFYSTPSDGFIVGYDQSSYTIAHNAIYGQVLNNWRIYVGQVWTGTLYQIYRAGLFFDTSSLPDDISIQSATLSLYYPTSEWDNSTADFDITIVNGLVLIEPLVSDNYGDLLNQTTSGGSRSTFGLPSSGYVDIDLNPTGLGWISKTGTTTLALRSSRDIIPSFPTVSPGVEYWEFVGFYDKELGEVYPPKLTITTSSDIFPPNVTNRDGATNITYSSARLNGEVTYNGGEDPTVHIYWGDNDGVMTAGNWDHDEILGEKGGTFYKNIINLNPSTTYYYRVFAENSGGLDWADGTASFSTTEYIPGVGFVTNFHPYPCPDFTPSPSNPNLGVEVTFLDNSKCYNDYLEESNCSANLNIRYQWDFGNGEVCDSGDPPVQDSSCRGNATTSYNIMGNKTITLTITDDLGTCTSDEEINVSFPLPKWNETAPY
ncbi:MAG: hypothetical protein A2Z78_01355 [Candidatus Nealsonbacteria bacterium RBG_13_36_15]|uniref:PKD domain-containing protein n=1 Tax=Candidatus Nealsonbacteria bacterium RBG_13_36_15 TaxID=1801660 RepID=A0A1G2DWZ9_9BACT|nr:MAG: hypothetical protein A2Z78_01355 [Candidatus Nealsonbacteria bacterium RBG_13_36_15]